MPSTNFYCEKCNFHGSSSAAWGHYYYLIDNIKVSANRDLGWCHECSDFSPIEHFDFEDIMKGISECKNKLNRLQSSLLMQVISKSRRKRIIQLQNKLYAGAFMLNTMHLRQGTEKCFTCGSSNVIQPLDAFKSNGDDSCRTGFIHPKCGGEFIIKGASFYNTLTTLRYYDSNGLFIKEEEDSSNPFESKRRW